MPNTPARALPYPPPTGVAPDVPYWAQALAEAVEAALVAVGRHDGGTGSAAVASLAAGGAVTVPITFEAGLFSAAPVVTVTLSAGAAGTSTLVPRVSGVTAAGCNVIVYNVGTAATGAGLSSQPFSWHAYQEDA